MADPKPNPDPKTTSAADLMRLSGEPDPGAAQFPGYEERGTVGRGGMAAIHRVFDPSLDREVAAKVLTGGPNIQARYGSTLVREAQITAQLEHPGIVPVHERGQNSAGAPFFTMKMVEGVTLSRWLEAKVPASGDNHAQADHLADALEVLLRVCEAVAFANAAGVVHRDIKPANIMVGTFGQVYLMDWGIAARMSDPPGPLEGTPSFMSPEQARGAALDGRSDLFALGAVLYYILARRPPYATGRSVAEMLLDVRAGNYQSLEGLSLQPRPPSALVDIMRRAMQARPGDRYASVSDFAAALRAFIRDGRHLPEEVFAPGQRVIVEGEVGRTAYVILGGEAEAWKQSPQGRQVLRRLGPGEVFGELAVLLGGPRTASVDAITELRVQVVSREMVERGIGVQSWVGLLARTLAMRFSELEAKVARAAGS